MRTNYWLLSLACLLVVCAARIGLAHDPNIFETQLAITDISSQIDPSPQRGGILRPTGKLNYQRMMTAIERGNAAALLAEGADPLMTSPDGSPIIFQLIGPQRKFQELEDFLRAGADPNRKNSQGETPLQAAIRHNNPQAIAALMRYGADATTPTNGANAIEYARLHQPDLVETLERGFAPIQKPDAIQYPRVLRQPAAIFGSNLFRPPCGGQALVYSNDSNLLISGGDDGAIRIFDAHDGEIKNVIAAHQHAISKLAMIPGSDILVSSIDDETKFWDIKSSTELMRLKHGGRGLSISPDGRWIFTGYHLWQIESVSPLKLSEVGRGYPQAGTSVHFAWSFFTPDSRYLIFGVFDRFIYIWDLSNNLVRRLASLKTADTRLLRWGDLKRNVDIGKAAPEDLIAISHIPYSLVTGPAYALKAFERTIQTGIGQATVLACSPNGRYLAAYGASSRIDVFDAERNGQQIPLRGHTDSLLAVTASSDGKLVASGGNDKTVRIHKIKSGEVLAVIPTAAQVYSLCFRKTEHSWRSATIVAAFICTTFRVNR